MKCDKCGFNNSKEAVFCEGCGCQLEQSNKKEGLMSAFSQKEKKTVFIVIALLILVPIISGIVSSIDSKVETRRREKETQSIVESTTENNNYYDGEESSNTSDYASEIARAFVNCDGTTLYKYFDNSQEESASYLSANALSNALKPVFEGSVLTGDVRLQEEYTTAFGETIEKYHFDHSNGGWGGIYFEIIKKNDAPYLYLKNVTDVVELYLPANCIVSLYGESINSTGIETAYESDYYNCHKYKVSYFGCINDIPASITIPGLNMPISLDITNYSPVEMDDLRNIIIDSEGENYFIDENLSKNIPEILISSMFGSSEAPSNYHFPTNIPKDNSVVEGYLFAESVYGRMFDDLSWFKEHTYQGLGRNYAIDDMYVGRDGYLYLKLDITYVYEENSNPGYPIERSVTISYKYENNQWVLTDTND